MITLDISFSLEEKWWAHIHLQHNLNKNTNSIFFFEILLLTKNGTQIHTFISVSSPINNHQWRHSSISRFRHLQMQEQHQFHLSYLPKNPRTRTRTPHRKSRNQRRFLPLLRRKRHRYTGERRRVVPRRYRTGRVRGLCQEFNSVAPAELP